MKKCNNKLDKKNNLITQDVLNPREKQFLKLIIEEYINTASPIGSNCLLSMNKDIEYSSATVRNIMAQLEKKGMLIKNHTSSGRVPSTKGFKYYEENLTDFNLSNNLRNKLSEIFNKRNANIDEVIDDSVRLISEILQLPTVITTVHEDALIKKIELIQLDKNITLIIIVFNDGNLIKNEINLIKPELIEDIGICVRILNDRLIDLTISQLVSQIDIVSKIIKSKVKDYEFVMQQIIQRIFNKNLIKEKQDVIATKNLLTQKEFQDVNKLQNVLNLLDNASIWQQLAYQNEINNETKITFGSELNNQNYHDLVIASTNITLNNQTKKNICIIGPTRMKYGEAKALLNFLKNEIEKK